MGRHKWVADEDLVLRNSTPVRVLKRDRDELVRIKAVSGKSLCELIREAIPLLREKYGVK